MHIPKIDPLPDKPRPWWSVMIPAYNGAALLATTLRSVLAQDSGPEQMQIEVVDDHSTREDLRSVVEEIGQDRVQYYRQPHNVGVTANFNTCVQRSQGHWVHLLHADDLVSPGFYETLAPATKRSDVEAAFCRFTFIDENGRLLRAQRSEATEPGILEDWIPKIGVRSRIQAPSIVVRRRLYERIGGYDTRLFHCADWDMWKRVAVSGPVWYEPAILAAYRVHSKSDTSALVRSGRNMEDTRRSICLSIRYLPPESAAAISRLACITSTRHALTTAVRMLRKRELSAALIQLREAGKNLTFPLVWRPDAPDRDAGVVPE